MAKIYNRPATEIIISSAPQKGKMKKSLFPLLWLNEFWQIFTILFEPAAVAAAMEGTDISKLI